MHITAQLSYRVQHRTVLIISLLVRIIITAGMMSTRGEGRNVSTVPLRDVGAECTVIHRTVRSVTRLSQCAREVSLTAGVYRCQCRRCRQRLSSAGHGSVYSSLSSGEPRPTSNSGASVKPDLQPPGVGEGASDTREKCPTLVGG